MLKRLLVISGFLILFFVALMIEIALGQQRSFPDDAGSIVMELWAQDLQIYSVKPASSAFGAGLNYLFSSSDLDLMNPSFDGFDCAPDGRSLMVHHFVLSRFTIADKTLTSIPSEIAYTLGIAWSPNGDRIAYINVEAGGIFLVNTDGSHLTRLTTPTIAFATSLSWSPDNTQIVLSANQPTSHQYQFSIERVDVASGHITPIFETANNLDQVAWSPDGKRIAFEMADGNDIDLYTIQPDGSHLTRLTDNHSKTTDPRWSPDGKLISFSELDDLTGHFQVYVMNADGSDPYLVYAPPRGEDAFDLCWLKA